MLSSEEFKIDHVWAFGYLGAYDDGRLPGIQINILLKSGYKFHFRGTDTRKISEKAMWFILNLYNLK